MEVNEAVLKDDITINSKTIIVSLLFLILLLKVKIVLVSGGLVIVALAFICACVSPTNLQAALTIFGVYLVILSSLSSAWSLF
jgi:hypothetical protein